ncbi:helix-turn-helix domain-containing protein [Haloarcula salina]|uniref:helix-turn-helix domain-containing protein n=1 Tax=Haloarcula salina TaxID=1429914 RepID=UPI003C6F0108
MRDTADQGSTTETARPPDDTTHGPAPLSQERDASAERSREPEPLGVEFCLSHAGLVLTDAIASGSDVTVSLEQQVADAESTLLVVAVESDDFEGFETALDADATVTDPAVLDSSPGRRLYRVEVTDEAERITPSLVRSGGRILEMHTVDGQWQVCAQFVSRTALSEFRTVCTERNVTFRLDRLYRTGDGSNAGVCGLTADQQTALETAHREGYFDVPRGISQAELADELEVSPSAVSQRIRRGLDQVLGSELDVPTE